jgi:Ni/Co efflux regulator RcnB
MRRRAALSLLALLPVAIAQPAAAQSAAQILFSDLERRMIMDYYARQAASQAGGGQGQGRGRGHGGGLPPGIQRRLDRGGTLPPGLARKALPPGLAGQLPAPPNGYIRQVVGSDVVLVAIATGVIMDIIRGIARE